jgi:thiamine pyrophosphokinase
MKKRAIILSNGIIEDPSIIRERLKDWTDAIVIAADGGYLHAEILNLELHSIVGDLDSISHKMGSSFFEQGLHIQSHPPEKDETDLELALLYALSEKVEEILILGAIGGRLDMTLSNLLLMSIPRFERVRVEIWYSTQTAWFIRPPGDEVQGAPGDTLSLIPFTEIVKGITTSGLSYPLNNENLKAGPSRGLSNVLTDSTAGIELQEGILLAIHTPGHA